MAGAPWAGRRLHFVGVGGAGMSAYARAAAALGASVSGSDRAPSPFSEALRAEGVLDAAIGHARGERARPATTSRSSARRRSRPTTPSALAALERGLRVRSRAELLGELTALRRTIAVAGAHGKTTTASMIVVALRGAGLDPGYLIGGIVRETGRNGEWGSGEWLVVEADESDRSMLELHVEIAVADQRRARPPRQRSARCSSSSATTARSSPARRRPSSGTARSCVALREPGRCAPTTRRRR